MFLLNKSHEEDRTQIIIIFHAHMFQNAHNNITTKHKKVVQQNPKERGLPKHLCMNK